MKRAAQERERKLRAYYDRLMSEKEQLLQEKTLKLEKLNSEEARLRQELRTLTDLQGAQLNIVGEYAGHTIDCRTESSSHRYFYTSTWRNNDEKKGVSS